MTPLAHCSALILAAGKGTRMKSPLPKVMQPLLEEPMLYYVIQALKNAGISDIAAVIGHGGDVVQEWLAKNESDVVPVWQKEQLGTGHAVMCARDWLKERKKVLVVNGDMPMLTESEIKALLYHAGDAGIAFMTCDLDDAGSYGRVIRSNASVSIVEAKDATAEQLAIHEINVGIYLFDVDVLFRGLAELRQDNSQNEYYIVDLISWGCSQGITVKPVKLPADNLDGVNSQATRLEETRRPQPFVYPDDVFFVFHFFDFGTSGRGIIHVSSSRSLVSINYFSLKINWIGTPWKSQVSRILFSRKRL